MHDIYLEVGNKKTFASAVHWPGWSRSGQDEPLALETLLAYAPRYARILESTGLPFMQPNTPADFIVAEQVKGSSVTDFGAPSASYTMDRVALSAEEVNRYKAIFKAAWRAFDGAVQAAQGKELRKGPRGGGRELTGIIKHVAEADLSYLSRLGWKVKIDSSKEIIHQLDFIRNQILGGIDACASGQIPAEGPQGGKRWTLRFFARYVTWHLVDHTWEIEDRIM